MVIYVAMFDTKEEALKAVAVDAPSGWRVEEVIGRALDSVVERRKVRPRTVTRLDYP